MLSRITAVCPDCKFLGSLAKAWKVPVRDQDETGRRGRIIAFKVYPSGCLCGSTFEEKVDEKASYRLNLLPSWKRMVSR